MDKSRLHLIVKGRVQGVFYRVYTRKKAIELNLTGWVKNTYNGDVEIIALIPDSVQELYDLTIRAFNLSERFRVPVSILTDETIAHLKEKVVILSIMQYSDPILQYLLYTTTKGYRQLIQ